MTGSTLSFTRRQLLLGGVATGVVLIASSLLLPSLASTAGTGGSPAYIGKVFTGRVEAHIDDSTLSIKRRRYGTATAEFKRLPGNQAELVIFGTIDKDGDAGFTITGTYDRSGFQAAAQDLSIAIDPAGQISGGGTSGDQQFSFSGQMTGGRIALDVENWPVAGASPSNIRGIAFTYQLSAESASGEGSDRKCRKIRYEMRPVANIGDGTMSMIRVPVCLQ